MTHQLKTRNFLARNILTRAGHLARLQVLLTLTLSLALVSMATASFAQNLFSPALYVNDTAITNYELQQRIRLLKILRSTGDIEKEAMDRLVNERLQLQAATRAGIVLEQKEIADGIDEFAQRNQQTGEQFLADIAQQGVAPDSFRDFVRAGIAWRHLIRSRFSGKANITDAEIDRAITLQGTQGSARVLISEIFLPTNTPENLAISLELAPQIARLRSIDEFSDAARRFSAGPSRERGGRVPNWVPIENLPPNVRSALLTMQPGQVTEPIQITNALALFQLRALQEVPASAPSNAVLNYATYHIDGGHGPAGLERAAQVRANIDTCDDLYGVAFGQPETVLQRTELPVAKIAGDIALELAKLDVGEVSTALTRANGQTLVFLMLCARDRNPDAEVSRDRVRQSLVSQRLSGLADVYLDELRANATILRP